VGGGAVNEVAVDSTPLHPAWRLGGLATLNIAASWPNGADLVVKNYIREFVTNKTRALEYLIGEQSGSYFNEADP